MARCKDLYYSFNAKVWSGKFRQSLSGRKEEVLPTNILTHLRQCWIISMPVLQNCNHYQSYTTCNAGSSRYVAWRHNCWWATVVKAAKMWRWRWKNLVWRKLYGSLFLSGRYVRISEMLRYLYCLSDEWVERKTHWWWEKLTQQDLVKSTGVW